MDIHRKMKKHFGIKVNDRKVKILNYKRNNYTDEYTGEETYTIELITKIDNIILNQKKVKIEIEGECAIEAIWNTRFAQPGLFRYTYRIIRQFT